MDKQVEGSYPGATPSNGCATPKVRKASVTPKPSDKGNEGKGKG